VIVTGVVLAAGSGSRMGEPKGTLVVAGTRLVDRAVAALRGGGCSSVIAVVRDGVTVPGAVNIVNPAPDRGLRSSLELGLAAAPDSDAVAVLLADLPGISPAAVRAVLDGWQPGRIAIGVVGRRRVHPTVMAPQRWGAAVALAGLDEGARALLAAHPHDVDEIALSEESASAADLDTPADLAAWESGIR
jgi:CTP:molybdopterin cytidylyltransferase MocA